MAALIWTEPALNDLDAIADYIAIDNPEAARQLVRKMFRHVEQLIEQPESGSKFKELASLRHRQIVESPCGIIYRHDGEQVLILLVLRGERPLQKSDIIGERSLIARP